MKTLFLPFRILSLLAVCLLASQSLHASESEKYGYIEHIGTKFSPKSIVALWSEEKNELTVFLLPIEVTLEQITEIATKDSMWSIISKLKDPAAEIDITFNPDAKTRTLDQVAAYAVKGSAFNGKRGSSISLNRNLQEQVKAEITYLALEPMEGGKFKLACAGADELGGSPVKWDFDLEGTVLVKP